ncbi:hydrolase [Motiliproteus coralliicola]|uniref:Hydrolase n=1 Tax=Motiliproteus coralliicola TaxID=2283196 RepID=A0A369WC87_9GAMM|nr:hydrolase [Motiliproteus coralliicola]RDE18236.1 hydrolase [Motiliproteus coralliicola]
MSAEHDFSPWLDWIDDQQQRMLDDTIRLALINSGSYNVDGVNEVARMLDQISADLGGTREYIDVAPQVVVNADGETLEQPLGQALSIRKRPDAPIQVFLCGHLDTVFAIDHPFQQVRWLDEDTINGPGVADLKGGLVLMFTALMALERTPWADRIGWEVLLNPDEEIGSPGSAPLLKQAALRHQLGLIYEPSFPDGNLAGERKGSGNFSVVVKGRAAHAGREHHLGRNAIRALCDFISALDDLNGQRTGVTINPGNIQGGGAVNVVPDTAVARFNIRLERPADEDWCLEHINKLLGWINARDGISIELHGGFGRKPKLLTPANQRLFELVRECGESLDMTLKWLPTGGCCDGNNLAAAGLPNVDTLGVQGGKIHSSDEFCKVSSLAQRAKLSALLLMKLATSDDLSWLERR